MKINIGSGTNKIEGFVNIDIIPSDIVWDLNWGLPPIDGKVTEVRGMHIIEHLTPEGVSRLLEEIYKVLEPGGTAVFELPEIDGVFREYLRTEYGERKELLMKYVFGEGSREGQHHWWGWNEKTLSELMESKGFKVEVKMAEDYHAEQAPCFRIEGTK